MLKIQGLDKLRRQLDDLSRKAGALNGTNSVQLDQMLTPAFVVRHTGFPDVDTFFGAGGWKQMLETAGSQ